MKHPATSVPLLLVGGSADERNRIARRLRALGARVPVSGHDPAGRIADLHRAMAATRPLTEEIAAAFRQELLHTLLVRAGGGHALVIADDGLAGQMHQWRRLHGSAGVAPAVIALDGPDLANLPDWPEESRLVTSALEALAASPDLWRTALERLGIEIPRRIVAEAPWGPEP